MILSSTRETQRILSDQLSLLAAHHVMTDGWPTRQKTIFWGNKNESIFPFSIAKKCVTVDVVDFFSLHYEYNQVIPELHVVRALSKLCIPLLFGVEGEATAHPLLRDTTSLKPHPLS